MIRVSVLPKWSQDYSRATLPKHLSQLSAGFHVRLQTAVGKIQSVSPAEIQNRCGGSRFLLADFFRAVRCRFTAGQFDDANSQPLSSRDSNYPPNADFGVVRMRGDDKDV